MSKQFARSAKNVFKGYSSAQVLVRDATANDDRGTNIGALQEIAARTYDSVAFFEIMDMLDKRLNDKGKYWRHVVKALTLLDYLVRFGSENCVLWCKENLYIIKTLKEFRYLDDTGYDQGQIIRVKATDLTSLLADDERLRGERRHNQSRNYGRRRNDAPPNPPDYNDAESPRRRGNRSRAGSRAYSRPEGPPRNSTTEDDDLRRAIEESKRTVEEDDERRKQIAQYEDEDPEFQAALQLSKEEEELKRLQDMQRLQQQQQYLLQQQTGVAAPQATDTYVDMFGNPISAQEYNEYQQQQTLWEQQQQQQQQMAQQQYAAQQQQLQQQQMMEQQQQMQMQQQQMMEQERLQQAQMQQQQQAQYAAQQQPMETGSNNPFAINNTGVNAQQQQQPAAQQVQSPPQQAYNTMPDVASPPPQQAQAPPQQVQSPPQQPLQRINTGNEAITQKYSQLNSMLANGTGTDTFGNTGEQRIPAQHTATGTFINSQGTGYHQETNEPKNNPFLTSQYTGLPSSGIVPLHTGYGFGNQGPQDDQPQQQQQQPQAQQQSQPLQQQQTQYTQFVQNPAQQQQQTGYPQPPQFQTPNQYQQQQQPNQYQQQPNQYQQQPSQQTPDQGVSLIDL